MDDFSSAIKKLGEFWAIAAGLCAFAAGWLSFGRRHGRRLLRSVDLSDHLHQHFGHESTKTLAGELHRIHIDGAIREVRIALLERRSSSAIYVCDSVSGGCTYANSELADMYGMDAADFAGNGWTEGIVPEERAGVFSAWQNAIGNCLPYECEYTVLNRRTEERFRVHTRAYPAKLKSGKVVWYVGTVERISDPDDAGD